MHRFSILDSSWSTKLVFFLFTNSVHPLSCHSSDYLPSKCRLSYGLEFLPPAFSTIQFQSTKYRFCANIDFIYMTRDSCRQENLHCKQFAAFSILQTSRNQNQQFLPDLGWWIYWKFLYLCVWSCFIKHIYILTKCLLSKT